MNAKYRFLPPPSKTESQEEFLARALKSREAAKLLGKYYSADEVMLELDQLLFGASSRRAADTNE